MTLDTVTPEADGWQHPRSDWTFWIGSFVASVVANANDGSDSRNAIHLDIAWSAIDLVAAILAVLVVRRLTTGQEERHRGVLAGQNALPV